MRVGESRPSKTPRSHIPTHIYVSCLVDVERSNPAQAVSDGYKTMSLCFGDFKQEATGRAAVKVRKLSVTGEVVTGGKRLLVAGHSCGLPAITSAFRRRDFV